MLPGAQNRANFGAAKVNRDPMKDREIQDLVGRVMIDPDFLAELVRAPDAVLAGYRLSAEERAAILEAVRRLGHTPSKQEARAFQSALVKRWAT